MSTPDLMAPEVAEQRREIVALARDFAAREIAPHAGEWDRAKAMPREVLAKLGGLGVFGVRVPEEYGGRGAAPSPLASPTPGGAACRSGTGRRPRRSSGFRRWRAARWWARSPCPSRMPAPGRPGGGAGGRGGGGGG